MYRVDPIATHLRVYSEDPNRVYYGLPVSDYPEDPIETYITLPEAPLAYVAYPGANALIICEKYAYKLTLTYQTVTGDRDEVIPTLERVDKHSLL